MQVEVSVVSWCVCVGGGSWPEAGFAKDVTKGSQEGSFRTTLRMRGCGAQARRVGAKAGLLVVPHHLCPNTSHTTTATLTQAFLHAMASRFLPQGSGHCKDFCCKVLAIAKSTTDQAQGWSGSAAQQPAAY
eukprot:25231-Chlamydomonas_euryale.AAC.3